MLRVRTPLTLLWVWSINACGNINHYLGYGSYNALVWVFRYFTDMARFLDYFLRCLTTSKNRPMKYFHLIFTCISLCFLSVHANAITLTPESFGAKVDDGKPDDVAFQAMFDAIPEKERNVVITLSSGEYLFDKTVFYPKYNRRRMMIEGNHATIKAVGLAFDILSPSNIKGEAMQTALDNMDKLIVNDLSFEGGDTQLRLIATLNSEINNCEFVSGNRGIDMVFCLMGRVINCQFTRQKVEQLLIRSGQGDPMTKEGKVFSNANGTNSQSNMVTVDGCRFFSELHAHACIRNYASNSMSILNTVFEGMAPRYSVDYHDRNSPTCTYMFMRNIHIEHPYDTLFTKALIRAEQNGGIVHLDGVFSQTGRTVQVEAGKSIVKISNWAYLPGGFKFKANGGGQWIFEDNLGIQGMDMLGEAMWEGKPPYYIVDRFAAKVQTYSGWSPTLMNGEEYISLTQDKMLQTTDMYFDKGNAPLKAPKSLDDYEIVELKPYLMNDPETGEQLMYYLPVLAPKK